MEMTAFKQAADGNGYVIRVADRYGHGSQGSITFDGQEIALAVAPFDVVTLRLTLADGSVASDRMRYVGTAIVVCEGHSVMNRACWQDNMSELAQKQR